eukprot:12084992-Prorocentrum_lima.AAC.1
MWPELDEPWQVPHNCHSPPRTSTNRSRPDRTPSSPMPAERPACVEKSRLPKKLFGNSAAQSSS